MSISTLDPKIISEIKRLHFDTKRLAADIVSGEYKSAFRGRGIEFEEVRDYMPGDEIRAIDWKVTARMGKPFIKIYREERELTVIVAIDVSASTFTGTRNELRETLIAKIGAVLALIALRNNDKVGLVTFCDQVEHYFPPQKAKSAVWQILHEVLSPSKPKPNTDISQVSKFLNQVLKRSSVVFIISDFFSSDYEKNLAVLARRHDVTAVTVRDRADSELPNAGIVELIDPESGKKVEIDTSNKKTRKAYKDRCKQVYSETKDIFKRNKIGHIEVMTDEPFLDELRKFFGKKRK